MSPHPRGQRAGGRRRAPRLWAGAAACCLALVAAVPGAGAQTKVAYVSVHGDTNDQPLIAAIEKMPSDTAKKPVRMGSTELPKGEVTLKPPIDCQQGERVHIYVETGHYLGTTVNCAARISVVLTSWRTMAALLDISESATSKKNFGLAALTTNEAAARLNVVPTADVERALADLGKAEPASEPPLDTSKLTAVLNNELAARQQRDADSQKLTMSYAALLNAGKYLDVETPATFDPSISKYVMSKQSWGAIKTYQSQAGLKVSGQLDYPTLQKFAKVDLGDALTKWAERKTND